MRILMLSWEYPPLLVGGLGRHVHGLTTALRAAGHSVTVVTRSSASAETDVVGVPEDPLLLPDDPFASALAVNHALSRAAARLPGPFDVVHAHDWLVAHSAVAVRDQLGLPLVTTIHATEAGRHQGWLPTGLSRAVHSTESWLANSSDRVVVCSHYMRWEVNRLLGIPADRLHVIPNGADPVTPASAQVKRVRLRFGGTGPLLGFAGRLVYEKGVQDLIAALPALRDRHPGLRLLVAGDGPHRQTLTDQAAQLGVRDAVSFAGFLGPDLAAAMAACDVQIVPSRYEPFGMVAIEAAAAGTPVVAAATGGLKEIVEPGRTGLTFPPGDRAALARAVTRMLDDRPAAARMARTLARDVEDRYSWPAIAERTVEQYRTATGVARPLAPDLIELPAGNLLFS
ncbi:glycosyltransferase family 4 protein [Actinoplanes sp. RD1]|uniref:glycosyltransferase family 4 protein n=1 Tax=Actinoplanes sp. RD1 TaxID=3064538 RepID=UPI002741269C|nr:glycosyltransferase family 4 protein [Actinoplanes sp. RD1]